MRRYSVSQQLTETVLGCGKTGKVDILEIRRLFWKNSKVREQINSLFRACSIVERGDIRRLFLLICLKKNELDYNKRYQTVNFAYAQFEVKHCLTFNNVLCYK